MIGEETTAVTEGGYLLPARQGGRALVPKALPAPWGSWFCPRPPLALAVKDNRVESQEAAGGYACCGWQFVAEAGFLPSRPAGA